jgi:hypothetical protein
MLNGLLVIPLATSTAELSLEVQSSGSYNVLNLTLVESIVVYRPNIWRTQPIR